MILRPEMRCVECTNKSTHTTKIKKNNTFSVVHVCDNHKIESSIPKKRHECSTPECHHSVAFTRSICRECNIKKLESKKNNLDRLH